MSNEPNTPEPGQSGSAPWKLLVFALVLPLVVLVLLAKMQG